MSNDVPVPMATTQPAGDSTLLDLLGMDTGAMPTIGQTLPPPMQQPPMETGLLDLLGDSTPISAPPIAESKDYSACLLSIMVCMLCMLGYSQYCCF